MEDIIIISEENTNKEKKNISDSRNWAFGFLEILRDVFSEFSKIKIKEKIIFYRLTSTMLDAGMSLIKSIAVLEGQEKNPKFKKILSNILIGLKEGKNLSECMDVYYISFSRAEIGVIKAGEKTGKLNEVMTSLADQVEKVASIGGKLRSALIYPTMIIGVVIGVIFIMMTVVVPKLLEIFDDGMMLPASTNTLIFISDIFVSYWYVILLLLFFVYISVAFWKKTESGKYNFDKTLLSIPILGTILQKVILSKFARIFSGLMLSGVSVVEGLKIVSDAVGNEVYRQRILLLLEDVRQGMKIWESLEGDELFPDIMVQMIQVGEKSAKLDTTIIKVADFYDEQVDNTIRTINKLLEPIIIISLAVVVGFIAIAIMQPIMNLADTVANS